jgi:hypothetical protein
LAVSVNIVPANGNNLLEHVALGGLYNHAGEAPNGPFDITIAN